MTNNLQTLTDLANSAKAHQEKFDNTLIEIHKQSAYTIASELTKTYKDEISEMKENTKKQLSAITYEIKQSKKMILAEMKPAILQSLISGTSLIILIISLIVGFLFNFWLYNKKITNQQTEIQMLQKTTQILQKWQIPMNYRYSQQNNTTGETELYLMLPPNITIKMKDGTQYLKLN